MRIIRFVATPAFAGVPRRGYYQPPPEPRGNTRRDFFDGPGDGGIAQFKDMLPDAQEARLARDRREKQRIQQAEAKLTKEEFLRFSAEQDAKHKKGQLTKVPTTIEELPQSDQDWIAGKTKEQPIPHHPFILKRAKAMLAGTWIPAVSRNLDPNFLDEFKQPLNKPDAWIEKLDKWEGEYWDPLTYESPRLGLSRAKETRAYVKALMKATVRATKGQKPGHAGNLPTALLDIIYDHQFIMGEKPDGEMWEIVLSAAVKNGDWRIGYIIEDIITEANFKVNADLLKQLDELAQYAWDKGYLEPPQIQGRDLSDIFKIDTQGGVGAYLPIPRGETYGYELFAIYDQQKKDGTFRPALGTPAWEQFVKDKPELQGRPQSWAEVQSAVAK